MASPPICMTEKGKKKKKIQIDRIIRGHDLLASQLLSIPIMRFRNGDVTGRRKKKKGEEGQSGRWTNKTGEEKEISGGGKKRRINSGHLITRVYVCYPSSSSSFLRFLLVAKGRGSRPTVVFESIFRDSRRGCKSVRRRIVRPEILGIG